MEAFESIIIRSYQFFICMIYIYVQNTTVTPNNMDLITMKIQLILKICNNNNINNIWIIEQWLNELITTQICKHFAKMAFVFSSVMNSLYCCIMNGIKIFQLFSMFTQSQHRINRSILIYFTGNGTIYLAFAVMEYSFPLCCVGRYIHKINGMHLGIVKHRQ